MICKLLVFSKTDQFSAYDLIFLMRNDILWTNFSMASSKSHNVTWMYFVFCEIFGFVTYVTFVIVLIFCDYVFSDLSKFLHVMLLEMPLHFWVYKWVVTLLCVWFAESMWPILWLCPICVVLIVFVIWMPMQESNTDVRLLHFNLWNGTILYMKSHDFLEKLLQMLQKNPFFFFFFFWNSMKNKESLGYLTVVKLFSHNSSTIF